MSDESPDEAMYVLMRLPDGTEVAYSCDKVTVCPNPFGITAVPGLPWRPLAPYIVVEAAEVVHIEPPKGEVSCDCLS